MSCRWILPSATILALMAGTVAQATSPLPHRFEPGYVDSGPVRNTAASRQAIFEERIRVEGATWLRLYFDETYLGQVVGKTDGVVLRVTSSLDGAVQELDAEELVEWRSSTAFFNGDEVKLEIVADPGATPSRVRVTEIMVGEPSQQPKSICGPTDDRQPSSDPRDARVVPVGCTAWLIDDTNGCFLSAGHCSGANFDVVEFNVPLSNGDGSLNHPPPEDQYAIDLSSVQWDQSVIGNDWAYFGAFPNAVTERTPSEAQGAFYTLGLPPGAPSGESITIRGYGTTDPFLAPPTLNQVQKTHTGPLTSVNGTVLQYQTDTTGGNSGSAIFNEDTGEAIGIHTNAGCSAGGGANNGMGLNNLGVQSALAAPIGICSGGPPPLRILMDPPDLLNPSGESLPVTIIDRADLPASPSSSAFIYDAGGGDQSVPLAPARGISANFSAPVPAMACGTEVSFRVTADSGAVTVNHPFSAQNSADRRYWRFVGADFDSAFRDTFESDMGWTVINDASLTDGGWERGVPSGYGMRGDPPWDADGSGQLFATGLPGGNNDVDGGPTTLQSPVLDATGDDPHISYWRWFDDSGASDDSMTVEVSDDSGSNWVALETIGPGVTGAWVRQTFRVADFVTPNDEFVIRFTVSDVGAGNIIEAAVDEVTLRNTASGITCGPIFSDGFESGDVNAWSISVGGS